MQSLEQLGECFAFLPQQHLVVCLVVSVKWRAVAGEAALWRNADLTNRSDAGRVLQHVVDSGALPSLWRNVEGLLTAFGQGVTNDLVTRFVDLCGGRLQTFNVNGCQRVTDVGLQRIAGKVPKLKRLELYWVVDATDTGVAPVVKGATSLVAVNFSGCKRVGDSTMVALSKCRGLVDLNLTRCLGITDLGLASVAKTCTGLTNLLLYACNQVEDPGIRSLSQLQRLEVLDLAGAQLVTDTGIQHLGRCSRLTSLNLSWCISLSDVGLIPVVTQCTALRLFSVHGLLKVTDALVDALHAHNAGPLDSIDVVGCTQITHREPEELLKRFPALVCFLVHT